MDTQVSLPAPDSIVALLASLDFDKTIEFYQRLDFTLVSRHDDYLLMRHGDSVRSSTSTRYAPAGVPARPVRA